MRDNPAAVPAQQAVAANIVADGLIELQRFPDSCIITYEVEGNNVSERGDLFDFVFLQQAEMKIVAMAAFNLLQLLKKAGNRNTAFGVTAAAYQAAGALDVFRSSDC
jgi:hypothetical protein